MAPKSKPSVPIWPALLIALVGLVWLGQSMQWIGSSLPLGPLGMLLTALALVFYANHTH